MLWVYDFSFVGVGSDSLSNFVLSVLVEAVETFA